MKILLVAEKEGTAIHKLCQMTAKAAPWHEYKIVCVHPKRPNVQQLQAFEEGFKWCDVVDFRYWRTAEMLKGMFTISKPNLLTHYNPYDLTRAPWQGYGKNIVVNNEQRHKLRGLAKLVPLPVDLDFWEYPQEGAHQKTYHVIMVANRIEGKKGVREVAQACFELGLNMALVGSISDPTYFEELMEKYGKNISFFQQIPDEDLRQLYYNSMIHVCNSIDNFESGTMPILEAMSCGTPVLTRRVGHVPDLFNGRNMIVRKGESNDVDDLKANLTNLINDPIAQKELRYEGRFSLRYQGLEIYGMRYSKIYHEIAHKEPLVSIIMPVAEHIDSWKQTLAGILSQTYPSIELLICDDGEAENLPFIEEIRKTTSIPIKYFKTATYTVNANPNSIDSLIKKTYGLARARNKGILEAEGKYLCFIDERMIPDTYAVEKFAERIKERTWLWGIKDDVKKGFVENFSFIERQDIISFGNFNEMISQYGGMTQEVRKRAELNKIKFEMVEEAKAKTSHKSRNRWMKNKDIAKSKTQCYKLYEG